VLAALEEREAGQHALRLRHAGAGRDVRGLDAGQALTELAGDQALDVERRVLEQLDRHA
jgi:hypothetical protein